MAGAAVRSDLFKAIQSPDDQRLQRIQDNLRTAINQLTADHDLLSVPVTALSTTAALPAGKSVAVYAGKPGAAITLPLASAQGANTAAIVVVANASSGAISLRPSGTDTINGAKVLAQAAGTIMLLTSDGVSKWYALIGASATSSSITYNVFSTTTNGLVPAPGNGAPGLFLRSDGVWADPTDDVMRKLRMLIWDGFVRWGAIPSGLENDIRAEI